MKVVKKNRPKLEINYGYTSKLFQKVGTVDYKLS
jgi:hypothetical protein